MLAGLKRSKIIKFIPKKAKTIFTKTGIPGAKWVINQYVGCEHDCSYCYAQFMSRFRPEGQGKWGSWVEAKMNAPKLVKGKKIDGWVYMSSVSDPYQPIEKELKLTRQILKNLDKCTKLSIQTKSDLVLRDLDILTKFKDIEIGLTINGFKGKTRYIFEPNSPSNKRRANALKFLKENKIKTYVFISPIIPGLIDLEDVIEKTKDYADYYFFEMINLKGAGGEFNKVLKTKFPESYEILKDRKRFNEFVRNSKMIINSKDIKSRGVEIH